MYTTAELKSYGDAIDLSMDDNDSISESLNKRIIKESKGSRNSIQKHDSILTMKDNKYNFHFSPKNLKEHKHVDVSPLDKELTEERDERIRIMKFTAKKKELWKKKKGNVHLYDKDSLMVVKVLWFRFIMY